MPRPSTLWTLNDLPGQQELRLLISLKMGQPCVEDKLQVFKSVSPYGPLWVSPPPPSGHQELSFRLLFTRFLGMQPGYGYR